MLLKIMYYQKNRQHTHTNTTYAETPADNILIVVSIFIVVFGIMAVFSASAPKAISYGDNPLSFTLKQFVWLIAGIFGAFFFSRFDYRRLKPFSGILAFIVLLALALVQYSG